MRSLLTIIRGLAIGWFAVAVVAAPLGAILLAYISFLRRGDNGLGDIIAFGVAASLLIFGAAGLVLGAGLAVLAKRALAAPAKFRRPARNALMGAERT